MTVHYSSVQYIVGHSFIGSCFDNRKIVRWQCTGIRSGVGGGGWGVVVAPRPSFDGGHPSYVASNNKQYG